MSEPQDSPLERSLEEIGRDECIGLLRTQAIGRLAVADHGYYPPHIVPVNFAVDGDRIVFRSEDGLKFKLSILAEHSVSFEVDSINREGHMAWSVVVQGKADLLTADEVEALDDAVRVEPWAPGDHREWVRITPYTISGRRVKMVPRAPAASG